MAFYSLPMNQSELFTFQAKNYQSNFFLGGQESCQFFRHHIWPQDAWQNDVTGIFWAMGMIDCDQYPVYYFRNKMLVPLVGKQLIFAGPHAIVRWFIPSGILRWQGIISSLSVPTLLQAEVFAFRIDQFPAFEDTREILEFVEHNYQQGQIISSLQQQNAIGAKIKLRIDQTYCLPQSDAQISAQFRLKNGLVTRYFKDNYGLTPIEYRNRKRVYDAIGLLLMTSLSLKEVALSVGFTELGRFTKNFKKYLNAYPSDLLHAYRKSLSKEIK